MKTSIPTYVDNNYLDTVRFEKLELVSAITRTCSLKFFNKKACCCLI